MYFFVISSALPGVPSIGWHNTVVLLVQGWSQNTWKRCSWETWSVLEQARHRRGRRPSSEVSGMRGVVAVVVTVVGGPGDTLRFYFFQGPHPRGAMYSKHWIDVIASATKLTSFLDCLDTIKLRTWHG